MCELTAADVDGILKWFAGNWDVILRMKDENDDIRAIISDLVDIILLYTPAYDSENVSNEDEYTLHIQIGAYVYAETIWAVTVDTPIIFKKKAVKEGSALAFLETILSEKFQKAYLVCSCLEFTGDCCYTCSLTAKQNAEECCVCLGNDKQRWVKYMSCGHQVHAACNTLLSHANPSCVNQCPICLIVSAAF